MTRNLDDYIEVSERIKMFKEKYPDGSLQACESPRVWTIGDKTYIGYCAAAYRTPDDPRPGIGWAWEPVPGPTPFTKDSELMNAETSAWGRAIVALGFDTKKIASANEVRNRQGSSERDGAHTTAAGDGSKSAASEQGQTPHSDGGALAVDQGHVSRSEGSSGNRQGSSEPERVAAMDEQGSSGSEGSSGNQDGLSEGDGTHGEASLLTGAAAAADSSSSESSFPPPATEKPATKGLIDETATILKLLDAAFPEHPGGNGRTWKDVAKEHCRDRFQKESTADLTVAEINELNRWLEEQYNLAAKEEAIPFG